MVSQQLAPISVHDLVKFIDHTCIVTEIRNQHGVNTFQLQDLDTGEIVRAFRFQLKVIDSGPLITELSGEFEMDGAEETATKTKTAGDRFVPMTSRELDDLASKRASQLRRRKDRRNGLSKYSQASTCQCLCLHAGSGLSWVKAGATGRVTHSVNSGDIPSQHGRWTD